MIDEKKVELMKKLQRLAERGVGGEKEQIQGGKRMNTPDARRIFEAIAMILSNRNDGVRVQLSEIKTKAAKAS